MAEGFSIDPQAYITLLEQRLSQATLDLAMKDAAISQLLAERASAGNEAATKGEALNSVPDGHSDSPADLR